MRALFVHDHIFLRYENKYYSKGKLTYKTLSYYLNYCDELTVLGRVKDSVVDPGTEFLSEGANIKVIGVHSPVSKLGIIERTALKDTIKIEVKWSDFLITRLPSELGLLANKIAYKNGKPVLNEMVASPFDCLWFRGDLFAKCYAPLLSWRIKRELKSSRNTIYVTDNYLQENYPSNGNSVGISDARVSLVKKVEKDLVKNKNKNKNKNKIKIKIGIIANPALALKGVDVLFRAVKSLPQGKFELSIVGGEKTSILENQMQSCSNISQLGFIAEKSELEDWLGTLDVYVQPSYTEGLPRSIIEAMSFGIPVLASNVGGIPELVHPEGLFDAGDFKALSLLLAEIPDNNVFCEKLEEHSYEKAGNFGVNLDFQKQRFIEDFINSEVKTIKEIEVL